jgi:leucyl aminopeptidase (aminopeptidase T)
LLSDTIAKRVVQGSLNIHEDDMVLIETWQHTLTLASEIAFECYKAGAKPLVTLLTDELWWNTLGAIPESYIRRTSRHMLNAMESTTAWIGLGGPQDPTKFREVASSRLESFAEADRPVLDKAFERKIRTAELILGQVTPERARVYGFNYEQWIRMTQESIKVDYAKMSELGRKISSRLEKGSKVRITSKTGTDVKFEITKRPAHVQDGIVDDEDIRRGLVSTQLPSGKVEVPPIEDSARGTVVFDSPRALKGRLIKGLTLTFDKGRIAGFQAKEYGDTFREVLEVSKGDKDVIAQFDIGLNPRVELIGYTTDELASGSATIGVGSNKGIGGRNDSSWTFSGTISKPTVEIDARKIVVDGRISL